MCAFNGLEWGCGSLHLTTPFRKGNVRIRVVDFNIKAQCALFPYDLTSWLRREPFNVLMDILIMLPKILLS
jgi:hypothetical protein